MRTAAAKTSVDCAYPPVLKCGVVVDLGTYVGRTDEEYSSGCLFRVRFLSLPRLPLFDGGNANENQRTESEREGLTTSLQFRQHKSCLDKEDEAQIHLCISID